MVLTVIEVPVATFLPEDEESTDECVESHCQCTGPPDHGVPDKVDLFVVFDPEILYMKFVSVHSEDGTRWRTIPRRRRGQASGLESKA